MSSGLSSFAILRLNDLVELSCEGIKKKTQQIPSQQPPVSQGIAPKLSALHYAWQRGMSLLCWLSHRAPIVRSAAAGSQMPLLFFLEAFLNLGSVQAEKCHLHPWSAQRQPWNPCGGLGTAVTAAGYKGRN